MIRPAHQLSCLRATYPEGKVVNTWNNGWCWTYQLQPRPSSPFYHFKITYSKNRPRVYVVDKLELADGQLRLPHVYSHEKQQLCLYLPNGREWNATMPITMIVPWISRWLYFYESWVVTGEWQGGGMHVTDENYKSLFVGRANKRYLKKRELRHKRKKKRRLILSDEICENFPNY